MPEYVYHCPECDDETLGEFPIGQALRSLPCGNCAANALLVIGRGVQIAPSALESKGAKSREDGAREQRWMRDIPAYQRMRAKGLWPKHVDGAAQVEDSVDNQFDIDYGHLASEGVTRERVREGKEQADQIMAEVAADSE